MKETDVIFRWEHVRQKAREMGLSVVRAGEYFVVSDVRTGREGCCETTESAITYMRGLGHGREAAEADANKRIAALAAKWREQAKECPPKGWQASILSQLADELEAQITF